MSNWFTIEAIDAHTWCISEYRHWEEPHCYLLRGTDRAVLIDTGLGVGNLGQVVRKLTQLPVTALLTHAHWDHLGGLSQFHRFALHPAERSWVEDQFPLPLAAVKANLTRESCHFPSGFRLEDYRVFQGTPARLLEDGDQIDLGGRVLTVLHTPGHSPGHCCFYEAERGYLFTGDLIYRGCLDAFYPTTDPVLFRSSVQRLQDLPVRRLLPGHHSLDLPVTLTAEVAAAFEELARRNQLYQGAGVFPFDGFQIHL